MKKVLRDILLIAALFAAILLAPLLIDGLSGPETPEKPYAQEVREETKGASADTDMPPQPQPLVNDKESALDRLTDIEKENSKNLAETDTIVSMDATNCPATNVGGQQDYDPKIETRQKNDTMIMPAAAAAQGVMDGNGGVDALKITDGGAVDADGKHLISFEIYDLRNGQQNALRVFAAGLASMNGRHAIIIGDREGDAVLLDPCLTWNDPIVIEDGPEPLWRYDAHDKEGDPASVSVTEGVKVEKQAR